MEQLKKYPRLTLTCDKHNLHSVRWNPEGNLLASSGKDGLVTLHRLTETELIFEQRFERHDKDIDQLCWNPEHPNILATASIDRHVKVWDARSQGNGPIASAKLKSENTAICWSNDGLTIAVADKDDMTSFIDVRSFRVVREQKFSFEVGEITWNKENDLFFVTSGEGNIHVLSYPDLQTLLVIDASATPCVCIRFDSSGKYFAVGSNDAIASIWDSENLACIQIVDRPDWPIKTLSFSHDSRYLASGSEDNFIDVADVHTGERASTIEVKAATLTLDFHPREYILAYASDEQDYRDMGSIKVVGLPSPSYERG